MTTPDAALPADLLQDIATPPEASPASPFSDEAFAVYAVLDDGSTFLAIIDPDPPEDE